MHTTTQSQSALQSYADLSCARQELLQAFWQDILSSSSTHGTPATLEALLEYAYKLASVVGQIPPQAMAIVLSIDSSNFARYKQTQTFTHIMQALDAMLCASNLTSDSLVAMQALQCAILAYESPKRIQESLELMRHIIATGLCDIQRAKRLFTMLEICFSQDKKIAPSPESTSRNISTKALEDEFSSIASALESAIPHTKPALDTAKAKLQNKGFSIGVAGVLSAGKSSFLNALLGKSVLGTSTIPETAALTILHYGQSERAEVEFFTPQELAQHKSSDTLTNEQKALLEMGQKAIACEELAHYTSANHKSGFYSLVKQVKLALPLAFLQNNVEIVDTPGLDDPVRIREELTKSYIQQCDMLIYVMNASCAATQKDMDFILESLIGGHLARILVVLTRADLLSGKELESSLNYTRQSLQQELQKARYDGDIQALLDSIDFIPVSSLFALGYKTDDKDIIAKAQAQGFTLEQTGLPKVQAYLESMLFGDNAPKQRDLLYSAYRGLLLELDTARQNIELQQRIMQANSEDRHKIAQELRDKNDELKESMHKAHKQLETLASDFMQYLHELLSLINAHLNAHIQRLFTQLYDDAIYEYAKNAKPSKERVESIINQSLQDSYHDLMREYKYKVAKKLRTLNELTLSTNASLPLDTPLAMPIITHPDNSAAITTLASTLALAVLELNNAHSKNSQEKLRASLQELLRTQLGDFTHLLTQENTRIQGLLEQSLAAYTKAQENALQEMIAHNLSILESTLAKQSSPSDIQALESTFATIQSLHNEVQMILKALR